MLIVSAKLEDNFCFATCGCLIALSCRKAGSARLLLYYWEAEICNGTTATSISKVDKCKIKGINLFN